MLYTRTGAPKAIDWGATGKKALLQSMDFALLTPVNSLFMARKEGWDIPIGETINEAFETSMAGNIANMFIEQFEHKGVAMQSIDFKYDEDYRVIPVLGVEIEDDEV
ncbi:hypothetical protein [Rummeliibacillus stabekisii]|uniref:hypothetical protein n=1 Tax=Rummeliibacillus stabekisii TaxID=241244 RepID=UPI0011EA6B59|nr:hypothetical protein [Rummeliibacillus stabekisii]